MKIKIPYGGKRTLQVDIPEENLAWVIDRKHKPALENPSSELQMALRNPIASPPLRELAENSDHVVVLVDDNTRPTPLDFIVPPILDELNAGSVQDGKIEIIIALGTHRKMTEAEIEKKLGKPVTERVAIRNFNCHYKRGLIGIGKTSSGIEVKVSKRVHSANLIIGVGNIVPHCYAGWAGGGKIVQPGVCGLKTIAATHTFAGKIRPISSIVGNLNQPIRKMIDEIALKVGLRFIVNTILNEKDEVSAFVVGDPIKAFQRGVELAKEIYCPEIPALADVVVVSSYPADIDYWQASKPADYACLGVKKGGTIILVTPCPEGVATVHPELIELGNLSYEEVCAAHEKGEIRDKVAAAALMLHSQIMEHANLICVSHGLTKEDKECLGFTHADSIKEALTFAFSRQGMDAKIGVMKSGDIKPVCSAL